MWRSQQFLFSTVLVSFLQKNEAIPGIVERVAGGGRPHIGKDNECNDIERSKDGEGYEARFSYPWGIAFDHHNNAVYVADCGCLTSEHRNDLIRKIDLKTQMVTTIAGSTQGYSDGQGTQAHFQHVAGMVVDSELELLYIADSGNHRIRLIYLSNNVVDTVAGLSAAGHADQSTISSRFNNPQSIAIYHDEQSKRKLYVADTDNHAIRVIHMRSDRTGDVKTLAGGKKGFKDGVKLNARFSYPAQIVIDTIGEYLYVSDHYNHAIRRIETKSGIVTTLTASGFQQNISPGDHLTFHYPEGLVHDPDRNILYVSEFKDNLIQVITMDGLVKPLAGSLRGRKDGIGRMARFYHPSSLTFDRKQKMLYVSDQYNHLIRSVSGVGSSKKFVKVKKKPTKRRKIPRKLNLHWSLMVAVGFLLVMFGALFVRPCSRLLFKWLKSEQQNTFHVGL